MATLLSLGLHEPNGLQYLISEGLLPVNANQGDYKWHQELYFDDDGALAIEEVLRTDTCVVWSRHGIIKRVFNLDIEAEQILHAFPTSFSSVSTRERTHNVPEDKVDSPQKDAALVVVLKTQAHIFCLSGATHVIPLSFEVARAFPSLHGCLLQPSAKSKPYGQSTIPERAENLTLQNRQGTSRSFLEAEWQENIEKSTKQSKRQPTFCITDLLSDIGLVAVSYSRRSKDIADRPPLPADEEILYVSTAAHLHSDALKHASVAVTINRTTFTLTIWHVQQVEKEDHSRKPTAEIKSYRQRQSSNYQERSRLPSGRSIAGVSRDSFAGLMQSFVEREPNQSTSQLSNIEHLAAELGQDFEATGVQTRSARRISSMLARTDLAPATERSAYNDPTVSSRKSLSRSLRHEGSFGSFTDRNSINARRSFPAEASILSNNTSFLDVGPRISINEGLGADDAMDDNRIHGHLDKHLAFVKVKSFSCDESSKQAPAEDFKILLIPHPFRPNLENNLPVQLSICVQESVPQVMTVVTIAMKNESEHTNEKDTQRSSWELKAIQVQKGTNITDACLVNDKDIPRLLVLSKTSNGDDVLHLEAPWSSSFRIDLPEKYLVHSPFSDQLNGENAVSDRAGSHRTMERSHVKIARFLNLFNTSTFAFQDTSNRTHSLRISMQPRSTFDKRVIDVCGFVLPAPLQDSLLVAYWEVERWLHTQDRPGLERVTVAIVLFIMATPFITALQNGPATPSRKKKSLGKRVSSGILADHMNWKLMQSAELTRQSPSWMHSSAWSWMDLDVNSDFSSGTHVSVMGPPRSERHPGNHEYSTWLTRCTDSARDFLQSPAGEFMNGPEGYLPTAINQDRNIRRTALATITVALQLLLEEMRLELPSEKSAIDSVGSMRAIIMQLSSWLNWPSWITTMKYNLQFSGSNSDHLALNGSKIDALEVPTEPFPPVCLYQFVENSQQGDPGKYHTLAELLHDLEHLTPRHPILTRSAQLLPLSATLIETVTRQKSLTAPHGHFLQDSMQSVLIGICNEQPQSCPLVEGHPQLRSDNSSKIEAQIGNPSRVPEHKSNRDIRAICNQALDAENIGRWDVSSETNQQNLTKLLFSKDRRFQEASRLVNQARPPEIEYDPQSNWTEADALEAQKLLAQYATRRTFAVVSGRGLMHYNARTPLLTEMVPRAQFSMQCILKPKTETEGIQSMTFSADRTLFTEDKVSWAFFHNGASAGLMVSKSVEFIDTSWILYNKPPELTNRHAGFLLALGLNGHLRSLAKWVAFKYLTPKHTMTSIGLLLGLAASYRGTADTLITRLLSVHVTCLLPPGAAELNLSPLTQVTGLVGIGLLYHDRQHRRMSEIMMSEIESQEPEERSGDESILRDEGYRLAAGIALGLINLGHGLRLHSLQDMRVVERLLAIAVGPKNVNLVHVLDRATAGAVVAIALVFMKTNDVSIASKIDIPDTSHQFEYVRPDIFLLRTLSRHLIMWDNIKPDFDFIEKSLPQQHRHRASLRHLKHLFTNDLAFYHIVAGICFAIGLKFAGSQCTDARDLLLRYLDQFLRLSRLSSVSYDAKVTLNGIRNCLDILALSCAMVMAGSGDLEVYRRLRALHGRTDRDTPFGSHLAAHMAIGALFLSGGTATFGTSNLAVASLVIAFYPLFPTDVLDNKGHLQALRHLWVLAVEHRCLCFRDSSNGQLIENMSATLELDDGSTLSLRTPGLLPELNKIKLIQVASEAFWPKTLDFDDKAFESKSQDDPTLTLREQYQKSSAGITIDLIRRPLYDRPVKDTFLSELHAQHHLKEPLKLQLASPQEHLATAMGSKVGDWIFHLPSFQCLDHAERDLLLTGASKSSKDSRTFGTYHANSILETTPVDTRLELENGVLGPEGLSSVMRTPLKQDKLWQIRLLLAWSDRLERTNGGNKHNTGHEKEPDSSGIGRSLSWIRPEVIERLRWRVWQMNEDMSLDEGMLPKFLPL